MLDFLLKGTASRSLPQPQSDNQDSDVRLNRYGGLYTESHGWGVQALADEGSYFVFTNPTPSTAIAYGSAGTQATFSDTAAFMVVYNGWTAADSKAKRVYLHYLKMLVSGTVPASATSTQFAIKLDSVSRVPTSNATSLGAVAANTNMDDGTLSKAQLWVPNAAVPVVPASGPAARLVARGSLRQTISVTLDEYCLQFGPAEGAGGVVGSTAGRTVSQAPPLVLGPQEFAVIHLWQPSGATNPLSFEFELGYWER